MRSYPRGRSDGWFSRMLMLLAVTLSLNGCGSSPRAPVVERAPLAKKSAPAIKVTKEPDWRPDTYTVQKGDTLHSIALEHGMEYRELAELNGIEDVNRIRVGRQLKLKSSSATSPTTTAATTTATFPIKFVAVQESKEPVASSSVKTQPKAIKLPYSEQAVAQLENQKIASPKPIVLPPKIVKPEEEKQPPTEVPKETPRSGDDENVEWGWPAQGKIAANFSDNTNAKGVDIAGKSGQTVVAAASGKVVYSGSGLRGYGKLIIIKHNKTYLSAYAHNNQILVREGQQVVKGQKIAEMGNTDADQVKLHFEIRRLGKPVDPMKYLSNEKP